jgi:ABC-2 type transport system permease protein
MRAVALIAWKDFKQIATSPLFFLMTALSAVIWSLTFKGFLGNFAEQMVSLGMQGREAPNIIRSVFTPHVQVTNLIFIVILPTLTMRLISEEKKSRTYDLLLTSPITATEIILGKFLAGLGATTILLLVSFLYPVSMGLVADFSWVMLLTLYLGMFLMSALYTASGLFASTLTESAMLAVFMGVIFNFLIWFIGPSASGTEVKWLAAVMEHMTVGQQMMGFINGSVQISALIFFVTVIGFFLFLSQRVVESSRWR